MSESSTVTFLLEWMSWKHDTSVGYGKMKRHLKVEIIEKRFCNLNSCEPVQGRAALSLMSSGPLWLLGHLPGSHSSPGPASSDSPQAYAEGASCSHWPIALLKQKAGGPGSLPLAGKDVAQPCKDAPLPENSSSQTSGRQERLQTRKSVVVPQARRAPGSNSSSDLESWDATVKIKMTSHFLEQMFMC